ncbi:penicillin-binding protein 1B [Methylobacter sp. YRD-M1]|uniref:penicillin-binding protein 1B n=1 Tax=Methylobacter sp. YRD-M1 TaxID=2911520 RepID=UPI00227B55F6|nr:penicillin-binding protein 1B [Methylobacter sp. YRD-M1]WAK03066.1 penicillin-binding protein 1B [Methylobacter sp. YRD-M1]
MVEKTKKRSSRYVQKKTAKGPASHWFRKTIWVFIAGFTFVLLSYLGYLDYNVRKQFEGNRWAIPARVYASPVELYAGYGLSAAKFEDLLQTLHYRKDAQLSSEGTYFRQGPYVSVKTRSFTFWDQQQSSSLLRLGFTDSGIANIVDLAQSKEVAIVRMDPVQIGSFYPTIKEDRILIKWQDAPEALIKGLLATEDRDFYDHFGISLKGIARAMWANVRAGGIVQGGSTITQQLVKNFYLTSERSLWRKVNEVFMSLILEARFSKNAILEAYLNEVFLGQDGGSAVHGFALASEFYFGSSLKDLPLEQVASLVALVRGPSYYDPRRYPERALQRRNLVLDEMAAEAYITPEQAAKAKAKPLNVVDRTHRSANRYPAFLDLVKRQLRQEYREEDLTSEGLAIFTTLDTSVQDALEKSVATKLDQLEKLPKAKDLETAVVVTRRDSGEIAALTGGRENSAAGFNRALDAVRPIGSLIKPVVYLTALEYPDKYTITTPVSDTAIHIKSGNKIWEPKNYDHREHGNVGLHTALAHSYNLATVRIGMDVGIARTVKTLRNMGVTRPVDLFPSFLLGAAELTPMEVTQMYQTLAGDGFSTPLRGIRAVVAANGERLQSYPFTVRQAVDPAATYIVNTMLQEVMREGTGHAAYSVFPYDYGLIGKTGTTNDSKDSWFAGYTGDYLSVVWVGRDDNKPIGLTGSTGALQVWISLMRQISTQPVNLVPPDNIKMAWVDPYSGLLANETCEGAREYPYIAGSAPIEYAACAETAPADGVNTFFNNLFPQ